MGIYCSCHFLFGRYKVLSYTNMFFTSKNTIVIILLIYRLIVVQIEKRKEDDEGGESNLLHDRGMRRFTESASLSPSTCSGRSRLVPSSSSCSNGIYDPFRCQTVRRETGSLGSVASVGRGLNSIDRTNWMRYHTVDNLNSPV